jgi:uncharacterized caspase-like protein
LPTQPDNVALDGDGRNSPFTAALLKHINTPGLELSSLMKRVRSDVVDGVSLASVTIVVPSSSGMLRKEGSRALCANDPIPATWLVSRRTVAPSPGQASIEW